MNCRALEMILQNQSIKQMKQSRFETNIFRSFSLVYKKEKKIRQIPAKKKKKKSWMD